MPAAAKVLFVVKSLEGLTEGEQEIETRLGPGGLGYTVETLGEAEAVALDVRDKALVVISANVDAARVRAEFCDVAVPVIVSGIEHFIAMKMLDPTQRANYGVAPDQTKINITEPYPPLSGDLKGMVSISSEPLTLAWVGGVKDQANKSPLDRVEVATLEDDEDRAILFGFRSGSPMAGLEAPCKRVGLPFDYAVNDAEKISEQYWKLFSKVINWAIGEVGVRQFDEIIREEWQEIQRRRELQYDEPQEKKRKNSKKAKPADSKKEKTAEAATEPHEHTKKENQTGFDGIHAPENLVGLALSGGGIRSATFCLGLLQGLQEMKLLRIFDYLSTVSGGGYLGGWWSAWLSRERQAREQERLADFPNKRRAAIFPATEKIEPERLDDYRFRYFKEKKMAEGSLSASKDP
ncbi:MAG TPA: hypothetical protein VGO69_10465, partial [Pyrinomonadaceae bacterium]|nr:hypothetical protein [Pyrinomonadaceae bacterium]